MPGEPPNFEGDGVSLKAANLLISLLLQLPMRETFFQVGLLRTDRCCVWQRNCHFQQKTSSQPVMEKCHNGMAAQCHNIIFVLPA
jgi:hypothetical protein